MFLRGCPLHFSCFFLFELQLSWERPERNLCQDLFIGFHRCRDFEHVTASLMICDTSYSPLKSLLSLGEAHLRLHFHILSPCQHVDTCAPPASWCPPLTFMKRFLVTPRLPSFLLFLLVFKDYSRFVTAKRSKRKTGLFGL